MCQLRMPENRDTIPALIQQTKSGNGVLVVHFTDPSANLQPSWQAEPEDPWGGGGPSSAPSSVDNDIIQRIAQTYAASQELGGRPLVILQVDRDLPLMDTICSQLGIVTFPTTQVWSRGTCETVVVGELERRLIALGVSSGGNRPKTGGGSGLGTLITKIRGKREGNAAPRHSQEGLLPEDELPPVEAIGMSEAAQSAPDARQQVALDALFGAPSFDED